MTIGAKRVHPATIRPGILRTVGWAVAIAAMLAIQAPCRADLIISTPTFADTAGNSGTFEVVVTNTNTVGDYNVAGFSTQVSVVADSGVTFTEISETVPPPDRFIFDMVPHDPIIAVDENDGSGLSVETPFDHPVTNLFFADFTQNDPNGIPYSQAIPAGESRVLAVISYAISASAPAGPVELTVSPPATTDGTGGASAFYDAQGQQLGPQSVFSGNLIILRSIPEPSSLVLAALGGTSLLLAWMRRRPA